MSNRSRKIYRSMAEAGQAQTIALTGTPPWNSTLLQISIHYGAPVTNVGSMIITKISSVDVVYNQSLYVDDPSIDGKTSDLLLCDIEFVKGDSISVAYLNPSNVDVGVEVIFEEGQ